MFYTPTLTKWTIFNCFFIFLFFLPSCKLKGDASSDVKQTYRQQKRAEAIRQIRKLHDGALLVRLSTMEYTINALRKAGKNEKADLVERKLRERNKKIVSAFRSTFDFAPVYFFYSDQSRPIRKGQMDSVTFLNDSLEPDNTIRFKGAGFLIAEFGRVSQDTARAVDQYSVRSTPEGAELRENYYGGANLGFTALVVRSEDFVQLSKPFPYYVRTYDNSFLRRDKEVVVERLDEKLQRFYDRQAE